MKSECAGNSMSSKGDMNFAKGVSTSRRRMQYYDKWPDGPDIIWNYAHRSPFSFVNFTLFWSLMDEGTEELCFVQRLAEFPEWDLAKALTVCTLGQRGHLLHRVRIATLEGYDIPGRLARILLGLKEKEV